MFYCCNLFLFILFFFISTLKPASADNNAFPLSADDEATIQNDINFLTNGVTALKLPNQPANLNAFGKFAYILAGTSSVNVWAAGRLGSGKVCAFTSNRYCKMDTTIQPLDNGKVMQNCINWVSKNTDGSLPASSIVGIVTPEMTYNQGFTKSSKTTFQTLEDLNGIQFVVVHESLLWSLTQSQLDILATYVKGGGGLIACNAPWDKYAADMPINPGNTLLVEAGLRWTPDSDSETASVIVKKVPLSDWWKTNPWYTTNVFVKGLASPPVSGETTIQGNMNFLTNGVNAIKLESTPGSLIAFGKYSYILAGTPSVPVSASADGVVGVNIWASGHMGSGKVCAFSANMFCKMGSSPPLDNGKVMQNCINWVSNNTDGSLPASSIVGMVTPEMTYNQGFTISSKKTFQTATDLVGIKFVVVHESLLFSLSQSQLDVLANYVKGGGGLIACNAPWDLKEETMPTNPGNTLLAEAGLRWSTESTSSNSPVMLRKYQPSEWWKTNSYYAGNIIGQGSATAPIPDISTVLSTYSSLLSFMSDFESSPYLTTCAQIVGVLKVQGLVCNTDFVFPVSSISNPGQFNCVKFVNTIRQFLPLNENHPTAKAASIVPGYPSGSRQTQTVQVTFPMTHRRWLSSGYFIWPGSYLNVTVPDNILNKGFEIQVGVQDDKLASKSILKRWPIITNSFKIKTQNSFSFFTFAGGPLYLYVPGDGLTYGINSVTISFTGQIVQQPYFKLGKHTESDWASMLASNTAPLGEVETDWLIVTVDVTMLKTVANITALALWHNSMMSNYYNFRGNPIREYKERFVADMQISSGWGHAGYPIMADEGGYNYWWTKSLLWPPKDVRITNQYETKANYWAMLHELGHNWQVSAWTTDDEVQVTNEIFCLYNEEIYPDGPNQFGSYNYVPGTTSAALYFYVDLRLGFGWEAFKQFFRLFETNADLGNSGKDQAVDNWLRYFSQTVKRDISSLMDTYKKPYSQSAKQASSQYTAWNTKAIIDCRKVAFPTSPCMTVYSNTTTSLSFSLVLWARINYTEAMEIRFVEPEINDAITGVVEDGTSKFWEKYTYNSSTKTLRLQPYKRMNSEDKISFSVTTTPSFKFTEVWVKIVDVATSRIIHAIERSLESVSSQA